MELTILADQIVKSKEITVKFDADKTYNKFQCNNNYIGVLGEIAFDKFLTDSNISHIYNELNINRWGIPPFVINGHTVTIKTTRSSTLWLQRPKFDFTIYAKIPEGETELKLDGFVKKEEIMNEIRNNTAKIVNRAGRSDYVFGKKDMHDMNDLIQFFKTNKWPKKENKGVQSTLKVL